MKERGERKEEKERKKEGSEEMKERGKETERERAGKKMIDIIYIHTVIIPGFF